MQLTQEEEEMIPNGKEMNWNGHHLVFESTTYQCRGCFFEDKDECPDCDEGLWVEENPSPWHIGKPTEQGWYFCLVDTGSETRFMANEWKDIVGYQWVYGFRGEIIAWRKAEDPIKILNEAREVWKKLN